MMKYIDQTAITNKRVLLRVDYNVSFKRDGSIRDETRIIQSLPSIKHLLGGNNKIVIATDADVDGMHIRLLLLTFFLQFFPDLVKNNHVYILQTPLFRVRNKKDTIYCYSNNERVLAIENRGPKPEITRFKGLW